MVSNDQDETVIDCRRKYRFSTRQLFFLITVVTVVVGLTGGTYRWHLVRQREHQARQQINPYGGVYTMASARYGLENPGKATGWFFNTFQNYVAEVDVSPYNWHAERLGTKALTVDDDALAMLQGLPQLRRLDLREAAITDHGIEGLLGLRHMEYLDLRGTNLSQSGVERIRTALPECEVLY